MTIQLLKCNHYEYACASNSRKKQSNTPTVDDPTTPSSNSDKQSEKKQEKKSLLPSTGDSSGLGLMILGLVLVLSVIFGFVYKAKRAKA